jgi:hypothetical protein
MMLLLASRALLAAAMVANIYAPTACALSSLGLLFQLLCDRLDYHNNRYALALYGLALLPHLLRRGQDEPENSYADLLPVRLQCAFIYLCSGGSKALDTDWRSGRVIAERIATFGPQAVAKGVPSSVVHFLGTEACSSLLAKGAISLELALVVLPFFRKTRKYVLFAGVLFHLVIEVVAKVEGFSALTLLAYLAFVPPRNYGPQR